jgi:ABC-type phosphate transport system substrate-binding protein
VEGCCVLLLFAALASLPSMASAQQLIANPGVGVDRLSAERVRSYFTMRLRRWPDGTPVRVFVLPDDNPVHRDFSKKILHVLPHQLRRAWDRLVFAGTGQAPTQVETQEEMLNRVAETPGAVGYVGDGKADARVRKLVVE